MWQPARFALALAVILTVAVAALRPAHASIDQAGSPLAGVPQFEVDASWPKLPPDWSWGQVIGIFADAQGHVWLSSRNRISEWAPDGSLVQSWDARGPAGNWSTIHGLFVDHNGFVWTNARESNLTVKFTRTGQVAMVIGRFNETGGSNDTTLMGRPSEIWVDPADNEVFVADGYGNRRVIVFDGATGKYLRHWGAYGKRPEDPPKGADDNAPAGQPATPADGPVPAAPPAQLRVPHGIIGSRDGQIYVADRANNRIQAFRQDGQFVREKILRPHCGAEERATWAPKRPCGREAAFSVGLSHDAPQSFLYVADGGTHVITILRRSDLEIVGEFAGVGLAPGQLGRPHNLTVDPSGNIFVAEAAGPESKDPRSGVMRPAGSRAQKFRFTGVK
jgi:DNA-binding beta-propeller fold protein YncE